MCMPPLLLHCQTEEIKSGAGEPHLISSALITSCCLVSPRGLPYVHRLCSWSAAIPSEDVPDRAALPRSVESARI